MTPQELMEGNKAIALFDGLIPAINGVPDYDRHWELLMPVVEKIEKMEHKTIIGGGDYWGNYCNIMYGVSLKETDDTKAMGQGDSKIEAVYKAVVQFIQWYNTTPSPSKL